jgi:hypothetical protein
MTELNTKIWFPDPINGTDTYLQDHDHDHFRFLNNSSWYRAQLCREFLNYNLDSLPSEISQGIYSTLRNNWQSGFFELILARTLEESGAENIEYESIEINGIRPDFSILEKAQQLLIEAVSPIINIDSLRKENQNRDLVEIVLELLPSGRNVSIWELPDITATDSKKIFKRVLKQAFVQLSTIGGEIEFVDINLELDKGLIRLTVYRDLGIRRKMVSSPMITGWDDSLQKIPNALEKKYHEVKKTKLPFIIAINCSAFLASSDNRHLLLKEWIEDLDNMMFGNSLQHGFFADHDSAKDHFIGVIFFHSTHFTKSPNPVFYKSTKYGGRIPGFTSQFENRSVNEKGSIESIEGNSQLFEGLRFVEDKTLNLKLQ